ncbi:MAG: ABC transporter ATP-binding protein [Actinomycetota bacterium]|nr:ABC transporter ATP-binding protein [Actinomycetota bacterium]
MLLETKMLLRSFGGIRAVDEVSLSVEPGELRALIGPNGAGKSTLFSLVSGHLQPDKGTISFDERRIERMKPAARARLGIAITFQTVHLFQGMTVLENVMVGAHSWTRHEFVEAALRLPRYFREEPLIRNRALEALLRAGLEPWAGARAESLPLGKQRALQIARALCGRPKLLLLDEPAAGLRGEERRVLAELLLGLREEGLTMVLVEHDIGFVSEVADWVTVLDMGKVIAEGTPAHVRENEAVISAYLGSATADDVLGTR